nr:uncharacterized protein LOC111986376 [Quercus suber]XP_023888988.1 uncharacterized protein LOC112001058 [Quercus suber]
MTTSTSLVYKKEPPSILPQQSKSKPKPQFLIRTSLFSTKFLKDSKTNMNSACKAWIVATSIAAVETLKDQGVCRWNFVIRSMQQHAKNNIRSYYQAKKLSAQSSSAISNTIKRSKEDSIRKVMDLSCWGPNTIRF